MLDELEKLLTVDELADKLRISRSGVYAFVNRGVLPAVKMGRVVRFSPQAIRKVVAEMQSKPLGDAA